MFSILHDDNYFMNMALLEANKAFENEEVPVGAIITENNTEGSIKVIAKSHNLVEKLNDATAHAEMLALTSAFSYRNSKYLPYSTLYVTLEPCLMCAYAIYLAKVSRIVYACDDPTKGFLKMCPCLFNISKIKQQPQYPLISAKTIVYGGILEEKSSQLLKKFFKKKR